MKTRWLIIVSAVLVTVGAQSAIASDLIIPFLQGLRSRGYYDTAEEYLDRVEKDPKVSTEIKQRIPYERALNLTEQAFNQKNADLQHRLLDRAAAELDKFIAKNPGHVLLGDAKTRRGNIFLGKARAYVLQSKSPSNAADRDKFRGLAKKSIDTARAIFVSARDDHEKRWKALPPRPKNRGAEEKLHQAEVDYMKAQIDVAQTTYEESQIHPPGSSEFRALLTKAAREFEAIHTRYRSQIGGLLSRMWQGKCFEEQDEIGRALGIYNELLEHPGTKPAMINLQSQVWHFKLICLNHDQRKDYLLVQDFATEWLKKNRSLHRTMTGLGIRYQLAAARERLAVKPTTPKNARLRLLRQAQTDAEYINRYPGKYKDVTTMMISRLKRARGIQTKDPVNFPDAYSAGQVSFSGVKSAQKVVDAARAASKPKDTVTDLQGKLKDRIDEASRFYRLALKLARPTDNSDHVNTARYLLAYLYYLQADLYKRRDLVFDAAVLADFVAKHHKEQAPDMARDAAYLAMACYGRIHNQARGDRSVEMGWIVRSAKSITTNWPGSKRAVDATYKLGEIYDRKGRPLLAARWYSRVPASAKNRYSFALLRTGQSYWAHYLAVASRKPSRQNQLDVIRGSVGEDWANAVADLLNPTRLVVLRIEKTQELNTMPETPAAKTAGKKDAPGNQAGPQPTGISKKKNPKTQKKPGKQKPAGKKPGKKKPAEKPAAKSKELAAATSKSRQELLAALKNHSKLTPEALKARSNGDLRKLLVAALRKLSRVELENRFEKHIAALSDEALKTLLQQKISYWKVLAAWYLKSGIDILQTESTGDSPADLIAGKASLCQYRIGNGAYQKVIALLSNSPHSVLDAIKVAKESERPADRGIKSRRFAGLVYQLLARGYIGVRKLPEFQSAMKKLEQVAAGDDKQNVTAIYEQLGRQLQREFERLKNQGQVNRLKDERENFKWVAVELFKRKADLQYNTLIWIAETSYGMGEGLGNADEAADYFKQAADAYQQILENSRIDKDQRLAVRLRLANCRRRQQDFVKALEFAESVIKENPKYLRAQFEVALILQNWGSSGKIEKFLVAISGDKEKKTWGWAGIATRLLQTLNYSGSSDPLPADRRRDYRRKYLQAQYLLTWCRMQYGIGLSADKKDKKRHQILGNALRELKAFSAACGVIDDQKFMDDSTRKLVDAKTMFNALFRDIQLEMDKSEAEFIALKWPVPQPDEPNPVLVKGKPSGKKPPGKTDVVKAPESKKPAESSAVWTIVGLLFAVLLLGGGGWFLFKFMTGEKKRRPAYASYGMGDSPFAPTPKTQSKSRTSAEKPRRQATRPSSRKPQPGPAGSVKPQSKRPKGPPPIDPK